MADQPKHEPPQGCEKYDLGGENDLGALSEQQQIKLNEYKKETRKSNEKYLREHPEVECLLSSFLGAVFLDRPENVRDYAADYFTDVELPSRISQKLQERLDSMTKNKLIKNM